MDDDFRLNIALVGILSDPDEQAAELARLLREVADKVESGQMSGRIMDINGNGVGDWEFD